MKHQLSRWWAEPGIWSILFALLFDSEISSTDGQHLQLEDLRARYLQTKTVKLKYSELLSVIVAMLGAGLKSTLGESNSLKPSSQDGYVTITGSDLSANKSTNEQAISDQRMYQFLQAT